MKTTEHVNARSYDFDGCLATPMYLEKRTAYEQRDAKTPCLDPLIEAHENFFTGIQLDIHESKYDTVKHLWGTNRQSAGIDNLNAKKIDIVKLNKVPHHAARGSCFPLLDKIADHVGGEADKFLMADLYNDLPHGTCLQDAIRNPSNEKNHWIFDQHKFTLLYAQIQKIANEHPHATITFDFYDDRLDILDHLHRLFKLFPHLMPNRVNLRLHRYDGGAVEDYEPILGTNEKCDQDYPNTIKKMVAGCFNPDEIDLTPGKIRASSPAGANVINALSTQTILEHIPEPGYWYTSPRMWGAAALGAVGFFASGGTLAAIGAVVGLASPEIAYVLEPCCKSKLS